VADGDGRSHGGKSVEEPGKARLRLGRSLLGTAEKKKEGERTSEKTTASDAAKAGARPSNFVETDADGGDRPACPIEKTVE